MATRGSGSSSSDNFFTPDTPTADSWQQYRCRSCDLPKRVPVRPSEAKSQIPTHCERCETTTQHRIDGGGGNLPMINLTEDTDISPAAVVGGLKAGRIVRTSVTDGGVFVELVGGDEICSECDELIPVDDFGEDAPFFNILANQSKLHGGTFCRSCHNELSS